MKKKTNPREQAIKDMREAGERASMLDYCIQKKILSQKDIPDIIVLTDKL